MDALPCKGEKKDEEEEKWQTVRRKMRHKISSPVVNDGIKGAGVFSVLCLGVAVVNGALIFMTVGRIKL